MISLSVLFWILVLIFAAIGAIRGWIKEILVTSSVILALFTTFLFEKYLPIFSESVNLENPFVMRIAVLAVLTFFGYQGPRFLSLVRDEKHLRDKLGNFLLGAIMGAINGYMIFGTAWYFLDQAGYPFEWISAPSSVTQVGQSVINLIEILPPNWLQEPVIYYSVAVAFGLILIAFI
jgi:uncharacterized membrane protein required for colicin V production